MESGTLHIWNLPKDEVYIKLKNNVWKKLFSTIIIKGQTYENLAKQFDTSKSVIEKLFNNQTISMSLYLLEHFSEFLVKKTGDSYFKLENLEKEILFIRCWGSMSTKIYYPRFPLNFDCKNGGRIIGGLMGDGGIRKDYRPFYTNKDKKRIKMMIKSMKNTIGKFKESKMFKAPSPTKVNSITYTYDFPKIIGIILCYGLNMVPGRKVINDPNFPRFCINSSISFKLELLKTFFTDEGTPHRAGKDLAPQISLRQVKTWEKDSNDAPARLNDIRILLESLGLKPTVFLESIYGNKNKRAVFNLLLSKLDDTRYFYKNINFDSDDKIKKLKNALQKTKRKTSFKKYLAQKTLHSISPVIRAIKILTKENKPIISKNVAKIINKKINSSKIILNKLAISGFIKLKKRGIPINGNGHTCDVFELTEKGEKSFL